VKLLGRPSPIDAIKVRPRYRDLTRGSVPTDPPVGGPSSVSTEAILPPVFGPSNVSQISVASDPPAFGPSNVTNEEAIGFVITINTLDKAAILAMSDVPIGTVAWATDTHDIYVYNTTGFDKWGSYEDN
jgi:hypothetical protein